MGWKDLFKSKTPRGKPDPRVRWFGKLPTYADYYSSPTDEDWAVEFKDWLLKGCELFYSRQRERGGDLRLPPSMLLVRLPKSQMAVFAAVQDYGGDMRGRSFPISFYAGLPSELWPGPVCDTVLPVMSLQRDLTRIAEQVVRFMNTPARFEDMFGGREVLLPDQLTPDESWRGAAGKVPLANWLQDVRCCVQAETPAVWARVLEHWGRNIAQLEGPDFTPTLRFPMILTAPLEPQVAGWLSWLSQYMDIGRRALSLLIAREGSNGLGRLAITTRDVLPEDLLLITSAADTLAYADDVCGLDFKEEVADPSGGSGPATWLDFVAAKVAT